MVSGLRCCIIHGKPPHGPSRMSPESYPPSAKYAHDPPQNRTEQRCSCMQGSPLRFVVLTLDSVPYCMHMGFRLMRGGFCKGVLQRRNSECSIRYTLRDAMRSQTQPDSVGGGSPYLVVGVYGGSAMVHEDLNAQTRVLHLFIRYYRTWIFGINYPSSRSPKQIFF